MAGGHIRIIDVSFLSSSDSSTDTEGYASYWELWEFHSSNMRE